MSFQSQSMTLMLASDCTPHDLCAKEGEEVGCLWVCKGSKKRLFKMFRNLSFEKLSRSLNIKDSYNYWQHGMEIHVSQGNKGQKRQAKRSSCVDGERCLKRRMGPDGIEDLPRTFPVRPWLDTSDDHAVLRCVLVGYSFRDSEVGYCQGLNYAAALLLLVMKIKEDAFWMLAIEATFWPLFTIEVVL